MPKRLLLIPLGHPILASAMAPPKASTAASKPSNPPLEASETFKTIALESCTSAENSYSIRKRATHF